MARPRQNPKLNGFRISPQLALVRLEGGREAYHYLEEGKVSASHIFPIGGFLPKKIKRIIQRSIPHV